MDNFKNFISKYWGAIVGGIIALLIALTGFYKFIICIILIVMGLWAGNYYQHNKDSIKNKIKGLIDKM